MRDLIVDVLKDSDARRFKSLVIITVVAISIGCLIASRAIAATASDQIDESLAATTLDEVVVTQKPDAGHEPGPGPQLLGETSKAIVQQISHVVDSASFLEVVASDIEVRRVPQAPPEDLVRIIGAESDYLRVSDATVTPDSVSSTWDDLAVDNKGLIGEELARRWGITEFGADQSILLGTQVVPVVGVINSERDPKLAQTIVITSAMADTIKDPSNLLALKIRTHPGASTGVAALAPELLNPSDPQALSTSGSENLGNLRTDISTNLDALLGGVGMFLWVLTLLVVANSALSSVMGRAAEIGLRRALGFSRRTIAAKFVCEGGILGLVGGLCGVGLGVLAAVTISSGMGWTPLIPLWLLAVGPAAGTLTGILASAYPALRASAVSPAQAVRSD